ncbi:hypothetical protein X801_08739 [Opisthorchis viverrini]|uniref:BLOC-1-related complex subunit 7 n=1 Tax=Opisthorchis viverrini TaxID=6198 RepID=A0A1S8WLU7_OPIVI|nr:hypothetical protein X801_08739 [Opisthorchis viverrini]
MSSVTNTGTRRDRNFTTVKGDVSAAAKNLTSAHTRLPKQGVYIEKLCETLVKLSTKHKRMSDVRDETERNMVQKENSSGAILKQY